MHGLGRVEAAGFKKFVHRRSAAAPAEIGVPAGAGAGPRLDLGMDREEGRLAGDVGQTVRTEPPKGEVANRRDRAPISSGENVDTFPSTLTLTIANGAFCSSATGSLEAPRRAHFPVRAVSRFRASSRPGRRSGG